MSRQTKKSFHMVESKEANSRNDARKRRNCKKPRVEKNDLKQDTSVLETQDIVTLKKIHLESVKNTDGDNLKNGVQNREAAIANHRGRKKVVTKQVKFDEKSIEETSPALKRHKLENSCTDSIGKKIESVVKKLKTHRSSRSRSEHSPTELFEMDISETSIKQHVEDGTVVTRNRKSGANKRISKNKSSKIDSRESRSKNSVTIANKNNHDMKTEKINFDVGNSSKSANKKPRKNLPPLPDSHCLPDQALSKDAHVDTVKLDQFSVKGVVFDDRENSLNQLFEMHNRTSENADMIDVISPEPMSYSRETLSNTDTFVSYAHVKETCEIADPFCQNMLTKPDILNASSDQQVLNESSETCSRNIVRNQNKLSELDKNLCQFIMNDENKENIDEASININTGSTLKSSPTDIDIRSYITKTSHVFSKPTKLSDDELKQMLNENGVPYWPNSEGDRSKCTETNGNNIKIEKQQQDNKVDTNNFLSCGDNFEGCIKPNEPIDENCLVESEAPAVVDTSARNINGLNRLEESKIEDKNADHTSLFYPGSNEASNESGLVKQEKLGEEYDAFYRENLSTNPVRMPFSLIVSNFPGDIIANSAQSNLQNEYSNETNANCFNTALTDAASAIFAENKLSLMEPQEGNEVFYICEECEFETKVENEFSCHYSLSHRATQPEVNDQSAICIQISNRTTQINNAATQRSDQDSTGPGSLAYPRTFQHRIKTRERKSKRLLVYDDSSGEGVVMYQCGVCQFRAEYGKQLEEHYAESHGLRLELFECSHPHCRFVTFLRESLLHHYRSQHVEVGVLLRPPE